MRKERNTSGEIPNNQPTRLRRLGSKFDKAIGPALSTGVMTEYVIFHNLAENPAAQNGFLAIAFFGYLTLPFMFAESGRIANEVRWLREKTAAKARVIFRKRGGN